MSEVIEVTYRPGCLLACRSGSVSEDLSPCKKHFMLFYNGILKVKVKQYVNNTADIATVVPTVL